MTHLRHSHLKIPYSVKLSTISPHSDFLNTSLRARVDHADALNALRINTGPSVNAQV